MKSTPAPDPSPHDARTPESLPAGRSDAARSTYDPAPPRLPAVLSNPDRIWIAGAVLIILIGYGAILARLDPEQNDFAWCFYTGAYSLRHFGSAYAFSDPDALLRPYLYPPFLAYLLLPTAWLSQWGATLAWAMVNMVLTAIFAGQLLEILAPSTAVSFRSRWRSWLVVWALLTCFVHQMVGNNVGQVHNLIAVPVAASVLSLRRRHDAQAGVWLSLAVLVKLFPVLLVAGLIALRRWRAVVAAGMACVVLSAVMWSDLWTYVRDLPQGTRFPTSTANQVYVSLPAMAERLFSASDYAVPLAESPGLKNLFLCLGVAAIGGVLLHGWRQRGPSETWLAQLICAMILLVPRMGAYHLNLMLIASAVCLRFALIPPGREASVVAGGYRAPSRRALLLTIVALALVELPVDYGLLLKSTPVGASIHESLHTGWGLLLLAPQTYGVLLQFVACTQLSRCGRTENGARIGPSGERG